MTDTCHYPGLFSVQVLGIQAEVLLGLQALIHWANFPSRSGLLSMVTGRQVHKFVCAAITYHASNMVGGTIGICYETWCAVLHGRGRICENEKDNFWGVRFSFPVFAFRTCYVFYLFLTMWRDFFYSSKVCGKPGTVFLKMAVCAHVHTLWHAAYETSRLCKHHFLGTLTSLYPPHIFFFFLMLKLWPRRSEVCLVLKACVFLSVWWWPSVTGLKRYSQDSALVIELWSLIGCSLNPFMLLACSVLLWAISWCLCFFIRKAKIFIIVHSMGIPPGLVFSYSLRP